MQEECGSTKAFCFLAGLGLGALLGVLFAPQSGEETRGLISDKAGESRDFVLNKSREVRDQAADYVERGKGALAEQRDHLAAAVEAGKQAYKAESQTKSEI
jgi:gas vesicle protein